VKTTEQHALVWKRTDFSETSRLVVLFTREEGKITALAKGAHRPTSPFLGRLDFLNVIRPRFARRRKAALQLLRGAVLLHEHRALRRPRRFVAASYLHEIFDVSLLEGRADPPMFDLMVGALRVLERCPEPAIPIVVAGIELKYLRILGLLPDLGSCSSCGAMDQRLFLAPGDLGLLCSDHSVGATKPVPDEALRGLRQLDVTPGREWGSLPPLGSAARSILGRWVVAALERAPRWRSLALQA